MPQGKQITFGRFRLDPTNECLWQDTHAISLRPKAFAVLRLLVEHPGQLVTKRELLEAVWPATFVSDAVLKASIRQLREAMGDAAESPQYIETAHRRGYRFIGKIADEPSGETGTQRRGVSGLAALPADSRRQSPATIVSTALSTVVLGREAEFEKLREWTERAWTGDRQVVFVTGEPGIGKTTLVNEFLQQISTTANVWIARGQCLEQFGAGEPYLPVLEGLSRLGRAAGGDRIIDLLRQHAPAWLLELPSLLSGNEREHFRDQVAGATRERMLREIADALEAITAETRLILVIEDLHWSDYATVDFIAYLARRRDPARLLMIGTYRPVDVTLSEHPLKAVKRELQAHGLSRELPLECLTEAAVSAYIAARFPGHQFPRRLTQLIHRRSEGNPLFLVNLVGYLIDERIIVEDEGHWRLVGGLAEIESGIPENIRQLIEKQIERLSGDERRALEGASVVGMECSSAAISAGLDEPTEWVDAQCEALVRRYQLLNPARLVELPDGSVTSRYKFAHVLYLEVPYRLLPPMRRSQIHRRIGERGEAIYGDQVSLIAAELAMHFEEGIDHARAVKYLLQAVDIAEHRSAHHEAETLARRGLRLLQKLPATAERDRQQLGLQLSLGVAVMAIKGFAAAEVKEIVECALQLCARLDSAAHAFRAKWLLLLFHYFRAELRAAEAIATELMTLAQTLGDPFRTLVAHRGVCSTVLELGRFNDALRHHGQVAAISLANPRYPSESLTGQDPKLVSDCYAARALWALGYPDAALDRIEGTLALGLKSLPAERLLIVTHFAAQLHQLRGEPSASQKRSEMGIALSEEYGWPLWLAFGHMNRGWARIAQHDVEAGIEELRLGLALYDSGQAKLWRPYYVTLLARALAIAGHTDEALCEMETALTLAKSTGESWCAAELYRVKGELLISRSAQEAPPANGSQKVPSGAASEAEACFAQALVIARQQDARSWELRAATSLGCLMQRQGRRADAVRLLRESLEWFTDGQNTEDLKSARALLTAWATA